MHFSAIEIMQSTKTGKSIIYIIPDQKQKIEDRVSRGTDLLLWLERHEFFGDCGSNVES